MSPRVLVRAEAALAPLDRARRALLAVVARVSKPLVAEREPRVAAMGVALVVFGFALSAAAPLWLLLLGPIVLGVPHVVSDVRYLVMRPGLHKRWPLVVVIGLPLVYICARSPDAPLPGICAGLVATAGALLVARADWVARAVGIAICGALFALAAWAGWYADLAFAHLHNVVAVGFFLVWRRRQGKLHWLPVLAFALGATLLLAGVAEPDVSAYPWSVGAGLVPSELATFGGRLVVLYAFAQSVHYTVWLRLVPEEDRERRTPRTFASTLRALVRDLGPWVLAVAVLSAAFFAAFAFYDVLIARDAYMRVAIFHGHLELACGALLLVERRLPLGAGGVGRVDAVRAAA